MATLFHPGAIAQAISDAKLDATELDGIAFTRGPGMKACLSVCANAAKGIAAVLKKPLVGVHHMVVKEHPTYPFITLLISGGHTLLLLALSSSHFSTLATTVDISIGNAYDRVSHLLGIKWGSLGPGAALEKLCADNPVPMHSFHKMKSSLPNPGELIFSYSGMLSAFQRYLENISHDDELTEQRKAEIAWTFQHHAIEQLESKLSLGLKWCDRHGHDIKHVVVSGGVANNAAMIAWASMERFLKNDHDSYDIDLRSEWSIEDLNS
ncbi:hypothetical protein Clacol_000395 [Clathrus columnatus]|uniref:N(6)-L-threonylcarbamoyladenine synthase n=1 Tax=Clathrus columnatus TaxID=1419009 RepID=A0AAV4ZZL1_9AGAM|nr:hypothetical protein Clacol_000395 [Clathrus columnatus]